jgi:transcriptional regulator with XRE-family HTH domain
MWSSPFESQVVLANNQRLNVDVVAGARTLDPAARLREAREAKGLSHRQLAEATKLSVRAIELLERGRIRELPEGIYRRSIIRAVAGEVGLNPEQVLSDFTTVHPDDLISPSAAVVVEPKPTSSFQKALAIVSAMLPMAAGVLYFTLPSLPASRVAVLPPSTIEKREPLRPTAEVMPVGGFAPVSLPEGRPVPVVVTLTISSRCQLRVLADGNEIVARVMEPGETLPIELGGELLLLGDNASAVQFSINGQAGRLLGEPGDILSARIGRDDYQDFLVRY